MSPRARLAAAVATVVALALLLSWARQEPSAPGDGRDDLLGCRRASPEPRVTGRRPAADPDEGDEPAPTPDPAAETGPDDTERTAATAAEDTAGQVLTTRLAPETLEVWEWRGLPEQVPLPVPPTTITAVALGPDGTLATVDEDGKIWARGANGVLEPIELPQGCRAAHPLVHPEGVILFEQRCAGSEPRLYFASPGATPSALFLAPGPHTDPSLSADGTHVGYRQDGRPRVWSRRTGQHQDFGNAVDDWLLVDANSGLALVGGRVFTATPTVRGSTPYDGVRDLLGHVGDAPVLELRSGAVLVEGLTGSAFSGEFPAHMVAADALGHGLAVELVATPGVLSFALSTDPPGMLETAFSDLRLGAMAAGDPLRLALVADDSLWLGELVVTAR